MGLYFIYILVKKIMKKYCVDRALGFTDHADILYVGTEDDRRVDS